MPELNVLKGQHDICKGRFNISSLRTSLLISLNLPSDIYHFTHEGLYINQVGFEINIHYFSKVV